MHGTCACSNLTLVPLELSFILADLITILLILQYILYNNNIMPKSYTYSLFLCLK